MSERVIKGFLKLGDPEGSEPLGYSFVCPGCKRRHAYYVREPNEGGHQWTFNGDLIKPKFRPSFGLEMHRPEARCHSFVTNGEIKFLDDCAHGLAGKTVKMEPHEDE